MHTLYVREVPEELYGALRRKAKERRSSISKEAVRLLEEALRSDDAELAELLQDIEAERPRAKRGTPSAARLIRQDRDR